MVSFVEWHYSAGFSRRLFGPLKLQVPSRWIEVFGRGKHLGNTIVGVTVNLYAVWWRLRS
jgi:hypothetical protein